MPVPAAVLVPAEGSGDDQPKNLTDRAARQAVDGCRESEAVERLLRMLGVAYVLDRLTLHESSHFRVGGKGRRE